MERLGVNVPMAQRSWSRGAVTKARVAASCQKRHPAATRPKNMGTPAGGVSVKEMARGGWASFSAVVRIVEMSFSGIRSRSPSAITVVDREVEARLRGAQRDLYVGRGLRPGED